MEYCIGFQQNITTKSKFEYNFYLNCHSLVVDNLYKRHSVQWLLILYDRLHCLTSQQWCCCLSGPMCLNDRWPPVELHELYHFVPPNLFVQQQQQKQIWSIWWASLKKTKKIYPIAKIVCSPKQNKNLKRKKNALKMISLRKSSLWEPLHYATMTKAFFHFACTGVARALVC